MSQERMEPNARSKTVFSGLDIASAKKTVQATTASISDKVRVIHGANVESYNLAGKTVGEVRKGLRDSFNIPSDAVAEVDGKQVNDEYILAANQSVEFFKMAGKKGSVKKMTFKKEFWSHNSDECFSTGTYFPLSKQNF